MNQGIIEKKERELLIIGARLGLKPDEIKAFQSGLEALFELHSTLAPGEILYPENSEEGEHESD